MGGWLRTTAGLALLLLLAGGAPPVAAQSLGELAQQEQERRKRAAKPAKSFTDKDLAAARAKAGAAGEAAPAAGASPSPSPSPGASPTPSPAPDRMRDPQLERSWRERFAAARRAVAEAEERAWVMRYEIVWVSGIPVQQQVRRFEETEELRQAKRALADLEEELRRSGLPPGWGRE
jgi:hypothetical protein